MIGELFAERYQIAAELGRGGMGVVYRAHDSVLARDVAVKLLSVGGLGTQGRARLLHEARAAARLNHPNIISVYDAGEVAGFAFVIMELLDGESLYKRRPGSLEEVLAVTRQICLALDHAHGHGIVHRDLKPENVIVTSSGLAKLTDFGLARSVASRLTNEGQLTGTVYYLAPEQALAKTIDGRTDLYALGVLLFELLTGQLPYGGDDPLAIVSQHLHAPPVRPSTCAAGIPLALDDLVTRLMAKQPDDRPASAGAVIDLLDRLSAEAPALDVVPRSPIERLAQARLVGREREFAEARAHWQAVVSGGGEVRVLFISGEPGVGKTPLVREIKALAEISGGLVLTGEAYAEGSAPYTPFTQILHDALAQPGLDLAPAVVADLATLAPDLRASLAPAAAPAGAVFDATAGATNLAPNLGLNAAAEQQRLFESFVTLAAQLAAHAPVLLVLEDVQWADSGSLFLVRHLARRARAARLRLLVVLTYRDAEVADTCCLPEVLFDLQRERLAARLKLARLDREQTARVLETMFREALAPELVDAIYRETEGNLFFIEEVCKTLIEDGKLVPHNGRWQAASLDDLRVPQSVRETIQARVGKLPEAAQEVLRTAAVIGREFEFAVLRAAGDWEEEALIEALEAAERAQLVQEVRAGAPSETFAFAHTLIPTALRDGLGGLRRRRLHRRVAAALAQLRPDDDAALAYHYAEAGDDDQARARYRRAGDRAAAVYANDDAVQAYTAALELIPEDDPERFAVLSARAKVHDLMARRDAQQADVVAMLALADLLDDDALRCDALIAQADYFLSFDFRQARAPAERAVALARRLGDPVRAGRALRRVGEQTWVARELAESRAALEAAVQRFLYAGLSGEAAACLHMLSLVLGSQGLGELPAAQAAASQAVNLSRQAGDRLQEAHSLRRLAIAELDQRRLPEALEQAEAALQLHRELGDRAGEGRAQGVLGMVNALLHRTAEAERYFRAAVDIFGRLGSADGVVDALTDFSEMIFQPLGQHAAELDLLNQLLAQAEQRGDKLLVSSLQQLRVRALTRLGQYRTALDLLEQPAIGSPDWLSATVRGSLRCLHGRLLVEVGELARARQTLESVLGEQAGRAVRPVEAAEPRMVLAYADLREGTPQALRAGLAQATQAVELLTGTAWPSDEARARFILAHLHLALGQPAEALAHTSEVLRLAGHAPAVPEAALHAHGRALHALGRAAEARDFLRRAYLAVQRVAELTSDSALRQGWLENVWINVQIAQAWASVQA
jgi:tetratricopeptide (TPR) repeat protein